MHKKAIESVNGVPSYPCKLLTDFLTLLELFQILNNIQEDLQSIPKDCTKTCYIAANICQRATYASRSNLYRKQNDTILKKTWYCHVELEYAQIL